MRLNNKYTKFVKLNKLPFLFPKRILNFKRSKWKNCQKRVYFQSKKTLKLKNPLIYQLPSRTVEKVKNYYRDGLSLKTVLMLFFDQSVNISFFKKELSSHFNKSLKELLINIFIKPCFRVDILLWKLNFFKSSFFASQYINEGKILINSKRVKSNYFLKKGDMVSFKSENVDLFFKFLNSKLQIYSFVEVDTYLKKIILIKDLKEFSNEDLNLMVQFFFNTNKLKDYLLK